MSAAHNAPAGWYPNGQGQQQWWDGEEWGTLTSPMPLAPGSLSPYAHPSAVPPTHTAGLVSPQAGPYAMAAMPRPVKDVGVAYILAILLGGFAAHRFYLGRTSSAVAFLAVLWLGVLLIGALVGIPMIMAAGLWWIIDLFLIPGITREANGRPAAY